MAILSKNTGGSSMFEPAKHTHQILFFENPSFETLLSNDEHPPQNDSAAKISHLRAQRRPT